MKIEKKKPTPNCKGVLCDCYGLVSLQHSHLALSVAMCKPGEVYCGSGQCRPHGSQCNLQACGDSSEETNCGNIALFHQSQAVSQSTDCIKLDFPLRMHSHVCSELVPFSAGKCYHMCSNKVCLSKSSVCDGVIDCKDRSDELNCTRACEFSSHRSFCFFYSSVRCFECMPINLFVLLSICSRLVLRLFPMCR